MKKISCKGYVSNIQDFSVHDGNGIRTTIFLSGCPLRCKWCSNPETWGLNPQIAVHESRCTHCNRCVKICPVSAVSQKTPHWVSKEKCIQCGNCVDVCPANAREVLGVEMSVDEVVKRVMRSMIFFRHSGGGVTFSGGEATFQCEFFKELINAFDNIGVNMTLETSGYFYWSGLEDVLKKLDLIFVDIKHMDSIIHQELTGQGNELILDNIKKIGRLGTEVVIRIPLIKGINDNQENIVNTAKFALDNVPAAKIEILPYHSYGSYKYDALNMSQNKYNYETPSNAEIESAKRIIEAVGVEIIDFK